MRIFIGVSVVLGFVTMGEVRAANLIKDPGFETPVVPAGSLTRFTNGDKISAWTVVGASGTVDLITSTYTFDGFVFNAASGKQWLDLTGASQTATGVAQTFATTAGASYLLRFSVGSVYDTGGQVGTTSTVYVMKDGKKIFKAVAKGKSGSTSQAWHAFQITFKATSSKTTLSFINGDPANDTDCGLDAVSVSAAPANTLLDGLRSR